MRYFCTYFDANYLPRARALHASLLRHAGPFRLFALCHDDAAHRSVLALDDPTLVPIAIAELERNDPELEAVRESRSRVEYYFSSTAAMCRYVLLRFPEVDLLTYLDADLYFFSSPEPVFEELEGASIGLIEHRFRPALRRYLRFGRYNVGWVSMRRDDDGLAFVEWWRARCLEWCFDRVEPERYADQKYLDAVPSLFGGVHVVRHAGANVAPWNTASYRFAVKDRLVTVDGEPLVFFHFSGVRQVWNRLYRTDFGGYLTPLRGVVRTRVYPPYIAELRRHSEGARTAGARNYDLGLGAIVGRLKSLARIVRGLLFREFIVVQPDVEPPATSSEPGP
jgi:hypothetical protein